MVATASEFAVSHLSRASVSARLRTWVSEPDAALIVTVIADVALALGAFTLSFDALRELALAAGLRDELVWIWPLVVDGFIVVSTINAVVLSERIPKAAWYPAIALVVFALVSVAGNGLHAARHADTSVISIPVAAVVSAIPAIALLISSHLIVVLLMARRRGLHEASKQLSSEGNRRHGVVEQARGEVHRPATGPDGRVVSAPSPHPGARRARGPAFNDHTLAAWVRTELEAGRVVTGEDVGRRLGMSAATGRRRLQALRVAHPDLAFAGRTNREVPEHGTR